MVPTILGLRRAAVIHCPESERRAAPGYAYSLICVCVSG